MKYIDLFEQWVPKLNTEPVPISKVGSFGQRITDNGKKKIKKQDLIVATDDTIHQIVRDEIDKLGKKADLTHIDVSRVTDMSYLFNDTDFQGDISEWDVRKVKNMACMFWGCKNFNCDISGWDVSEVEDMRTMFRGCEEFDQDLSGWNVGKVGNMRHMFNGCRSFNQDLSGWKVGTVRNMDYMFWGCRNFDQDLSGWDIRRVNNNFQHMFDYCPIKPWYKPKF